jgi:ATP-dependent Clp protease adaptor protein ClpS
MALSLRGLSPIRTAVAEFGGGAGRRPVQGERQEPEVLYRPILLTDHRNDFQRIMSTEKQAPAREAGTVVEAVKPVMAKPPMYQVVLLNDDYTPMEFVVHILERFFNKDREAATRIMLHVHHHGIGECGVFTYEVAETKVTQVMDFARKHQHPLQCVMEKK